MSVYLSIFAMSHLEQKSQSPNMQVSGSHPLQAYDE